ncbi:uncharacterized protein LOC131954313 [Physella acuta]|uniref:uncharacterized protein LOC131954313 n=1 Tax=Physella acuta TaxID=109671 RepID=UPI0027DB99AE|nr:uncharacterized protein LOC131954313 [Physella acuta]
MVFIWCLTVFMLLSCSTADDQVPEDPEYSEAFLKLLYVFNGNFSDHRLVDAYKSIDDPDLYVPKLGYLTIMPVEVTALAPAVTYLLEEYWENSLIRRQFCILWEEENNQIYLQTFNITSPPNDMSKPFTLGQVKKLTFDDLVTRDDCKVTFTRKGTNTFTAIWPDCKAQYDGVLPHYIATFSCNSMVVVANNPDSVDYLAVPVSATREGPRFPFPTYLKKVEENVTCP